MIVPERTIDVWTALAVRNRFPNSVIWAPTTNEQAAREPWDLDVQTPKLFLIESKGLGDRGCRLSARQLGLMCALESAFSARSKYPVVFFGLPLGTGAPHISTSGQLGSVLRERYQRRFPRFHCVITPKELRSALIGSGHRNRKWYQVEQSTLVGYRHWALETFLEQLGDCRLGSLVGENGIDRKVLTSIVSEAMSLFPRELGEMDDSVLDSLEPTNEELILEARQMPSPTYGFVDLSCGLELRRS